MAAQENHLDVIQFLLANNARQDLATEVIDRGQTFVQMYTSPTIDCDA
jgi:hypothetical protein